VTLDQLLFGAAVMMAVTAAAIGLARRLNLGSIAALLLVGIVLGPQSPVPVLAGHVGELQVIGQVGVMLLLFLVGLDTQPKYLWTMRRLVFGFGSLEYAAASAAIAVFLLTVAQIRWQSAVVAGLGLAMSSSAIPLPMLQARQEATSAHGQVTVAADIFQSLMVIPVLTLIPLLGHAPGAGDARALAPDALRLVAALAGVALLGRVVLPCWLYLTARSLGSGAFPLIVLASVFAAGWILGRLGVSPALGAFMMGMLLSTSVYSAQVKAAVTPARHVLLGVFFVAVGMAIDVHEVAQFRGELVFYVAMVLLIKLVVVYVTARTFRVASAAALLSGLLLMPLDEIGFVIFASARGYGLLSAHAHTLALLAISLSFVVSPIIINLALPRLAPAPKPGRSAPAVAADAAESRALVLGYGSVGRAVCDFLAAAGIRYACLEPDAERIAAARGAGHEIIRGSLENPPATASRLLEGSGWVILTQTSFAETRQALVTLRERAPRVPVIAAVQDLAERDELRADAGSHLVALPSAALSHLVRAASAVFAARPKHTLGLPDEPGATAAPVAPRDPGD